MKKFLLWGFLMSLVALFPFKNVQAQEEPILTFACLSDLHSQESLINGDVNSVQLRGTVTATLNAIKEQENVDMIVLGGDYTSDCTISNENWLKTRELLINATRGVFKDGQKTPVIYVNGNHEYEVANFDNLPKNYNAGEYYGTPMKTDIGALAAEDCFYETATNTNGTSSTVNLLAAYHYVVKGFDFVVLNTGKSMFTNAWNYTYSLESVQWCANKLAEIYATDKNKTVFFLVHIPFSDSNSISAANKGMVAGEATTLLKSTLAQYPNLVMLYGHDHGKDSAYIRTATSQRVTEYGTDGNKWTGASTEGTGSSSSTPLYSIQNYSTSKYLGYNTYNLATTDTQSSDATITPSTVTSGAFVFHLSNATTDNTGVQSYVHCGSNGRFSGNTDNTASGQQIFAYEVADPTASTITATQVTTITSGKTYLMVGQKNGLYYALTDELYSGNSTNQRMVGTQVTISNSTITYTGDADIMWTFVDKSTDTEEPEGTSVEKSFFSSFMGSMRYYNNSIDAMVGPANSRIVQALIVYVYSDRVELKMKNYGESGTINGITINQDLDPYISYRTVTHSEEAVTVAPTIASEGGTVATGSEVTVNVTAPEWHNLYYTINGEEPTEESSKAVNGQIKFTPTTAGDYEIKVAAQEGIRLLSASTSVTYTASGDMTPVNEFPEGYCDITSKTNESCEVSNVDNVHSHSLQGLTISVAGSEVLTQAATTTTFNRLHDSKQFSAAQGDEITFSFTNGAWSKNVWIGFDWNRDGDFEDVRAVYAGEGRVGGNQDEGSITIAVPANAALGLSMLRIISDGVDCTATWNEATPMCGTHGTGIIGYAGSMHNFGINVTEGSQQAQTYSITASVNNAEYGTATVSATDVVAGTTVTFTAEAAEGYEFIGWTKNGSTVSTMNPYTINVSEDLELVANFQVAEEKSAQIEVAEITTNFSAYQTYYVTNLIDGSYTSKFWSDGPQYLDKYIMVDLGNLYNVDEIALYFADGDQPTGATVETSLNGAEGSWNSVATFSKSNISNVTEGAYNVKRYICNAEGAVSRYVRLRISTNDTQFWFQMTEFKVFGKEADPVAERTITVVANPAEGGTVTANDVEGSVTAEGQITLVATPNANYEFINWTDEEGNEVSSSATYVDNVEGDKTFYANFDLMMYCKPVHTTQGTSTNYVGQIVTLTTEGASVDANWTNPAGEANVNGYTKRVKNLFTTFAGQTVTLNITDKNNTWGWTRIFADLNGDYTLDDTELIYADADRARTTPISQEFTISADAPKGEYLIRVFYAAGMDIYDGACDEYTQGGYYDFMFNVGDAPPTYIVTATAAEGGTAMASPENVFENKTSTLTATADDSHIFAYWSKDGEQVSTENPYVVTVTEDVEYVANFNLAHIVTIEQVEGGTITVKQGENSVASGSKVKDGEEITITVKESVGKQLYELLVNGTNVYDEYITNYSYTTTVTSATTITAVYGDPICKLTYEVETYNYGEGYIEVWSSDSYDEESEQNGTLGLPLTPMGVQYNQNDILEYESYIYIFPYVINGDLTDLEINGELIDLEENYDIYGDIEWAVTGPVHIKAIIQVGIGVEESDVNTNSIYAVEDGICVEAEDDTQVEIYSATGVMLANKAISGKTTIEMSEGIYIVKVGDQVTKVVVK